MIIRFDNRVAIVTGAGAGLGRAHALLLAERGAKVVVNDLGGTTDGKGGSNAAADQVVAEIKAKGGEAVASYDSVADAAGARNIIDTAMNAFGRLDILLNNAGILRDKSLVKMDLADFELVLKVHLMGTVYCTKAAWPIMLEQKYGRIVLTSSGSGLAGAYGQANYGTAKAGMVGLMSCLKMEGEKSNVKINAIAPLAATRMTEGMFPEQLAQYLRPEFVSPAAVWMCSEQCDVSGEIIGLGGGYFSRVAFAKSEGVLFDPENPITLEMFDEAHGAIADMTGAQPYRGIGADLQRKLKEIGRL